ncbi:class C sortase, partial [Bacillus thuringiensis]|nr:class C sortase [Bacillus thuringiensis]
VTLVTCTPYGVNTHRLIVRGERVPFEVEEKEAVVAQVNPFVVEKWMIGIVIVLLFFIGMFLYFKVKKR